MTPLPLHLIAVLLVLCTPFCAGCADREDDTDAFDPISVSPPAATLRMYQGFFNDGDYPGIGSLLTEVGRSRHDTAAVEERIRPFVAGNVTMEAAAVIRSFIYPDGTADLTFSVRWRLHDATVRRNEYTLRVVAEDGLWRLPCPIEP